MLPLIVTALLVVVLLAWLRGAWVLARIGALPNLARMPATLEGEAPWPRLSVVVACRNEQAAVRQALSSLLAQDYPSFELIVVDDRSEDATGAILRELAAVHPALRVARVDELPPGWLGKTNALQRGAAQATGDWILFTDADVLFAPDALRRAVAWGTRDGLGHAVAVPHFIAPGLLERAFVSMFGLFFLMGARVDDLRKPGSAAHVGFGAFNLVRRDAYRAIGGHERLRFEVVDDLKLGLVLRRSGVRQGCVDSGGLVRVRWQRGFVASMRGLLKNFFAGLDYRWGLTVAATLGVPLLTAFPALCLLASPWLLPGTASRLIAIAAFVLPALLLGRVARRVAGGRGHEGLLLPLAGTALALVTFTSALLATVRGGVVWRGTRYALDELRDANVREADWPRDRAPG
ncbi:MAG TPA: glycosyltransferase family 2 protein [Polyangia bacterium]